MGIIDLWEITTDKERKRVDGYLEYLVFENGKCPVCGEVVPMYDHREQRSIAVVLPS